MSGTLRFVIDGREIEARAGETLRAPKQLSHTYRVESRDGARWLTITAHGQFERFVRAFGRQPTRPGLPDPSGPPTPGASGGARCRVPELGHRDRGAAFALGAAAIYDRPGFPAAGVHGGSGFPLVFRAIAAVPQ